MAWKDIRARPHLPLRFQELDHGKLHGADGCALVAVDEAQTTGVGICFRPHQPDYLTTAAAGRRDLTDDVNRRGIILSFSAARSISPSVRHSWSVSRPAAHIILGLTLAVGGVGDNDAGLDSVGEDTSQQSYGSRRCSGAPSHDSLPTHFLV